MHSLKKDRTRKFMLALRMGLPIFLLLITSLFLFTIPQILESLIFKVALLSISVLTIVYYIFYLINEGASDTVIDPLTKAYNRENTFKELKKMDTKGVLNSISLVQIKNISDLNDHYGYEKVNALLQSFIATLDTALQAHKNSALIGRLQGSDFIIASAHSPEAIKEQLLAFQKKTTQINGIEVEIASAVSVNSNEIVKNIEHLYDSLHQKLNKSSKQNIYIQDIQNLSKFEQEIIEALHSANFVFSFKPNQKLRTNDILLYEAIIKLKTKSYGLLPTKKYIPVINRLDLEQTFDLAIIKALCLLLKNSKEFSISFNISPFSLRSRQFAHKLLELLEQQAIDPSRLIIELYENKVYHDIQKYRKILHQIKGFGVKLCLDNFGAMNASLEYIKLLPIDIVQFDNQFSKNLHTPSYKATLKAFIKMCSELEVQTILKWIDTKELAQLAKELEVDYIQGFYVGKLKTQKDLTNE